MSSFPKKTDLTSAKSIIIDGEVHKDYKSFCRGKGLKIGTLTEELIKVYLANPKEIQKLIDESKKVNL